MLLPSPDCLNGDNSDISSLFPLHFVPAGVYERSVVSKKLFSLLCTLALSSAAATPASLQLTPYPNELELGQGVFHLKTRVRIELASNSNEDRFAASLLSQDLSLLDSIETGKGKGAGSRIIIARAESRAGKRILSKAGMQLPPQASEEGYILVVTRREAAVVAKTAAGIFYGVQTLRQLLHPVKSGGADCPEVRIVDWPAVRWRGVSLDISRGPIPTMVSFKREITLLAEYKVNVFSPYMENTYRYPSLPNVPAQGGAVTPGEAQELVAFAARYHVTIVPEQESFGHMHLALQNEVYQDLVEVPYGHVLSPASPDSYTFISKMFSDLAAVFPGPFFHIGGDETVELGTGRTKAAVAVEGYGKVYVDYLRKIDEGLQSYHRKLLFWGDVAVQHPEHVNELPKDMIAVVEDYGADPSFADLSKPFRDAGLQVWVAPGVSNWDLIYPDFENARSNIRQFVSDAKKLGVTGVLNCTWTNAGESTVNFTWYGLVYGAAHSWQNTVDDEQFNDGWDWTFYRAAGHHFVGEVKNLSQIHLLLRQAIHSNGHDSLIYWHEALSPDGQSLYRRMEPVAHQVRLTAEGVVADVVTNSHLAQRNKDLLDYTEFAARRFDYLGQKAIYATYIADLYAQAQALGRDRAAVEPILVRINGTNGLIQDMRDQITVLRDMYQKLWLGENLPYFLRNILVRYDEELLSWEAASKRIGRPWDTFYKDHVLPPLINNETPSEK
jgi:hexosaminidase